MEVNGQLRDPATLPRATPLPGTDWTGGWMVKKMVLRGN